MVEEGRCPVPYAVAGGLGRSYQRVARMEIQKMDSPVGLPELPDLFEWNDARALKSSRKKALLLLRTSAAATKKLVTFAHCGRWRESRRGPSFLKIGGRYFYTIGALRDFYQRSIRGRGELSPSIY